MVNLEQEAFASLSLEVIDKFRQFLNISERIFDSAFKCVAYAPFSRQASRKQHEIYMENRRLIRGYLNEHFFFGFLL